MTFKFGKMCFASDAVCRPVLILGPLADCVADKLTIDFPQLFQRCLTTTMNCTQDAMEKGLQSNIFVDYRRRGSIYECTTVQAIRELGDKVTPKSNSHDSNDLIASSFLFLESSLPIGRMHFGYWKVETNPNLPNCSVASLQIGQTNQRNQRFALLQWQDVCEGGQRDVRTRTQAGVWLSAIYFRWVRSRDHFLHSDSNHISSNS